MSAEPSPRRDRVVLVTGGTGTLGRAFVEAVERAGWTSRVLSRRPAPDDLPPEREWARGDLADGSGLASAVAGVDAILHAATDAVKDPRRVDVRGTRLLLAAAESEGTGHLLFPSVVGIDRMPYRYYDAKLEAEEIVAGSPVPHTTVRITQFHAFVHAFVSAVGKLPVMPLPTEAKLQSIDVGEAAAHLVELLDAGPAGRAPPAAGPEVLSLGEMARSWARILGKRRWIVRLPLPGRLARGFRDGAATEPDRAVGGTTWEAWLERRGGTLGGEPE